MTGIGIGRIEREDAVAAHGQATDAAEPKRGDAEAVGVDGELGDLLGGAAVLTCARAVCAMASSPNATM